MKKKLLLFLTMVMALCCHYAYGDINIFLKQMSSGPITSDAIKQGTMSWDKDNLTLTLTDVETTECVRFLEGSESQTITINLVGNNVINDMLEIQDGKLQILSSSGGSLKVVGDEIGCVCWLGPEKNQGLTVKDCSVEMISRGNDVVAGMANGKNTANLDIVIENASFYAHGNPGI